MSTPPGVRGFPGGVSLVMITMGERYQMIKEAVITIMEGMIVGMGASVALLLAITVPLILGWL